MTVRWITEQLGTTAAKEARALQDVELVDVRDLVDKAGNRPEAVKEKVLVGVKNLKDGAKVIVCCDYGISRSNAIAAGILAIYKQIPLSEAIHIVQERTGETEIKLGPLEAVRLAIEDSRTKGSAKAKRTVLITGANGFLGQALCKRIGAQFLVITPSRGELDIELGSTQLSLLAIHHDVDCIIHLANPRVYSSNAALGRTLTMLRNILEVCATHNISLIYPSNGEIYSGYSGTIFADEAVPAFPRGPYGETKWLAEELLEHWQKASGIRCTIIRSSPVYGSGSDKPKFLYNFIEKARASETIVTHRYLNGDAALDLLYVDDFTDAVARACEQDVSGVFNIGTGLTTSTRSIGEMLRNEIGSRSRVEQTRIDAYTAQIAMNYQKAKRTLGWEPRIAIEDGLSRLLQCLH